MAVRPTVGRVGVQGELESGLGFAEVPVEGQRQRFGQRRVGVFHLAHDSPTAGVWTAGVFKAGVPGAEPGVPARAASVIVLLLSS